MSIERARVIKRAFATEPGQSLRDAGAETFPTAPASALQTPRVPLGRRVTRAALDGREEAERLVTEAGAKARAIVDAAQAEAASIRREAAEHAREHELARLAAEVLVVRASEERRREQELDRTIDLAVLLAERLVGEGLRVEPERIAALATEALRETRGARQLRIETSPHDADAMTSLLASLGAIVARVEPNAELARGSLVVHTELGRIDARLRPQLERLAETLREALREAGQGAPPPAR